MKKLKIALIFIAVVVIALLIGWFMQPKPVVNSTSTHTPAINITYKNLASVLSKNSMIQSVPENTELLLKFYNFNLGQRQWEKAFIIKKGAVVETTNLDEKADIILTLDSKYLKGLANQNFCSMIQQANKNGDLGFESSSSQASLAWKFKSMYKYRDCLGF